jgi:hypothetical protein
MRNADDDELEPKPVDPEQEPETSFTGGSGGPASVIYGDDDADEADEIGEEMLRAPDDES